MERLRDREGTVEVYRYIGAPGQLVFLGCHCLSKICLDCVTYVSSLYKKYCAIEFPRDELSKIVSGKVGFELLPFVFSEQNVFTTVL